MQYRPPTLVDTRPDGFGEAISEMPELEVSVVIPTYRRSEQLRAAVQSVLAQRGVTAKIEILVVDNDPDRSAEPLVASFASSSSWPLRYISEPRSGISYARNAGVASALGRFIAFLDDDECANPRWLVSLLTTAHLHAADIVVGPVRPAFPKLVRVPAYAKQLYCRDAQVPTGQSIDWHGIGNALLNRRRCFAGPAPFDPRLGLTGGEDSIFLGQLRDRGRYALWCAEAWVSESIPADKLSTAYLLRRAFRGGQTTTYLPSTLAPPRRLEILRWMAIGAAQVCLCGPWALALKLCGHEAWVTIMAKAASGLGKLLWHPALHVKSYRRDTSFTSSGKVA